MCECSTRGVDRRDATVRSRDLDAGPVTAVPVRRLALPAAAPKRVPSYGSLHLVRDRRPILEGFDVTGLRVSSSRTDFSVADLTALGRVPVAYGSARRR